MSASEEAKEIIRRWNEKGWSGGRYELAHEIISPNMRSTAPAARPSAWGRTG